MEELSVSLDQLCDRLREITYLMKTEQRRATPEQLKEEFLANLDKLCGRVLDAEDELTKQIYEKAKTKGLEVASELGHDWVSSCLEHLRSFQDRYYRYDLLTYQDRIAWAKDKQHRDPEKEYPLYQQADLALTWARQYFDKVPPEQSAPVVLELAVCLLDACFYPHALKLPQIKEEIPSEEAAAKLDLCEWESQARLGSSIRDIVTVFGCLAFYFTGYVVIIPIVMAAWVMAYALTDQKAIENQRKALMSAPDRREDLD